MVTFDRSEAKNRRRAKRSEGEHAEENKRIDEKKRALAMACPVIETEESFLSLEDRKSLTLGPRTVAKEKRCSVKAFSHDR